MSRYADRDTAQPGDKLDPADVPGASGPSCYEHHPTRAALCTLHAEHGGPQHVATDHLNRVTATWPTDAGRAATLDTAARTLVAAIESGEWDDLHALAADVSRHLPPLDPHAHAPGEFCDHLLACALPTVPEHAPADMPEPPRCPDCGLIPDRYRATCLTCLSGRPVPDGIACRECDTEGEGRHAADCPLA